MGCVLIDTCVDMKEASVNQRMNFNGDDEAFLALQMQHSDSIQPFEFPFGKPPASTAHEESSFGLRIAAEQDEVMESAEFAFAAFLSDQN